MVLVAGTLGIDTILTPNGAPRECIGGSAVHFSLSASQFSPVKMVGVVGEDFPQQFRTIP